MVPRYGDYAEAFDMGITKYYKAAGQVRVNLPIKWEPDIENAKAQNRNIFNLIGIWFGLQDLEVKYFHAFIDGVDFVFIDAPLFRHRQGDIYGGNRQVKLLSLVFSQFNFTALII